MEFCNADKPIEQRANFKSLLVANKNLSEAKNSSEVAFCYGLRSRVYFAMGQYRKCWRNIKQASDCGLGLPPDLDELRAKCLELMAEEDLRKLNFFRLSHPPNERNPSLVGCIELRENEQFGRHLVTTQKLKSGDIVAIEKPFYKSLDKNAAHGRCAECFSSNSLDMIPCRSCSSAMFCSEQCQKSASESFHKYECESLDSMTQDDGFLMMVQRSLFHALHICGGVENLEQLLSEKQLPRTVFDLDLHNDVLDRQKRLLLACHSLETSSPTKFDRMFASSFITNHKHVKTLWETLEQRDFLITFVVKLVGMMNRNGFTMHWASPDPEREESGCAIFPSLSLVNHSCSPNLFRILVDDSLVLVARRPIEVGEQLFICYQ